MSIEEKAKAYDEALERAREWKEKYGSILSSDGTIAKDFDSIFPELAESEDEKIRQGMIRFLESEQAEGIFTYEARQSWIAYLEKLEDKKPATIEQVYERFLSSDTLKSTKENKYIRAQLFWELMHNGIITEVDYQYLTDANRKPWTEEEYRKAYKKGFEASELLKHLGM